jgi:1-acyl-sn-glycerol-3-phosphate acyltransferase
MKYLLKIVSFPLSVLQLLFFGLTLLIFDVFQRISFNLFGYSAHKKTVDCMSYFLILSLRFIGGKITYQSNFEIPKNVPLIIVSNHQGLFDIPPIGWFFRNHHPKYVSKIELENGIPGISYNLKHGGSVLINRKDAKQSLLAISKFGKYIEKNNYAAVIFPEGTRSRDGRPLPFKDGGLKMLVKYIPSAYIVPVTINNSWKISDITQIFKPLGLRITLEVHQPMAVNSMPFDELFQKVESEVHKSIRVS